MSSPKNRFAFFQGKIVPIEEAKVSVMTHALHYGTGAFGGMRGYWNDEKEELFVFRPYDHFERLLSSAKMLQIDLPYDKETLVNILVELLRAEGYREDCYIRPLIYKSEEIIGVKLHNLQGDFTMFSVPFGGYLGNEDGARVGFSSWRRINDNTIPARGKFTGAYINSAFIKTEAMLNGFDEALVIDQQGHVVEGSAENIFIVRQGKLITPPVNADILEGITRRTVMHLLQQEMGLEVVERPIDRTELYICDEAFFCGSGVQIVPIVEVDHLPVGTGKMGPIVEEVRDLYFRVVRRQHPSYENWTLPIYASEKIAGD